ncbi:hypothetical protein L207DRAFT_527819 [Hyaloscypha variabilis F]|uniref:Cora-domain-containing protein n=1 Tax=Hyaloscypha variabilis (strain UAMH 11265 / GT02V1 / F) TaxID=1149755 RepID=A0A2J6RRN5_HYAVF|nr:hypothetical protein L207DRAFT_527819 [Hyaloscypha variabilis F]
MQSVLETLESQYPGPRTREFYDGVAVINRRASFWSELNSSGSWDALILVDPPLVQLNKDGHAIAHPFIYSHGFLKNQMVQLKLDHHAPYQGGYIDFIRAKASSEPTYTGPSRKSLFDDLIYYHKLAKHNPASDKLPFPDTAVFFLKNIVAGIWMNSIAYVGTSVLSLVYAVERSRKHLSSSQPTDNKITTYGGFEWLEKNLFHIYSWKRRCSQLNDWTDWNLQELENSRSQTQRASDTSPSTQDSGQEDWLFIRKRLEFCEASSRDIVASALGLLSLIESHKSVEEAESARVLALLGTVYLPLSLTAGLLSMSGSFTPGQSQFWIFFAVAGPLMAVSLGATYTPALMRNLVPWISRKISKDTSTGLKKRPTFVKEPQELVTVAITA